MVKKLVKNKTMLTFYGGVNEIGGNKILIQDKNTRVFFDFGMSFAMKKQFYSPPFLSPKSEKSLQELGILPKIKGVYKFDRSSTKIDAVFISHGHLDHSAYLSFIKREIPVYCGETTRTILQALSDVRRANLEFDVSDIEFKPEGLGLMTYYFRIRSVAADNYQGEWSDTFTFRVIPEKP